MSIKQIDSMKEEKAKRFLSDSYLVFQAFPAFVVGVPKKREIFHSYLI